MYLLNTDMISKKTLNAVFILNLIIKKRETF